MTTSEQKVFHRSQANHDLMTIVINDISKQVAKDSNLEQIVNQLGLSEKGYVFSINNQVIPGSEWTETVLVEGDRICLFQAIAGG